MFFLFFQGAYIIWCTLLWFNTKLSFHFLKRHFVCSDVHNNIRPFKCNFPGCEKGFPLQNKIQVTSELGIVTDIVCTIYSDQYFVVISQNGKFGTMIKATAEYHNDNSAGVTFETTVLLGQREDTLAHLYARQIIEKLSTKSDKPVIVSISLIPEGRTMETVKDVMSALFKE